MWYVMWNNGHWYQRLEFHVAITFLFPFVYYVRTLKIVEKNVSTSTYHSTCFNPMIDAWSSHSRRRLEHFWFEQFPVMYVWSPTDSIPQNSKQFFFTSLYSEHISSAWCSRHRFQRRILHFQGHDCRHPGNTVPLPWLDVATRRILEETSRKGMHSCMHACIHACMHSTSGSYQVSPHISLHRPFQASESKNGSADFVQCLISHENWPSLSIVVALANFTRIFFPELRFSSLSRHIMRMLRGYSVGPDHKDIWVWFLFDPDHVVPAGFVSDSH